MLKGYFSSGTIRAGREDGVEVTFLGHRNLFKTWNFYVCIQGDFFIALRPLHFENIKIGIICRPQIDFEHLNLILFSDFERVRRGGFFGLSI